jgi:hypothetical protein
LAAFGDENPDYLLWKSRHGVERAPHLLFSWSDTRIMIPAPGWTQIFVKTYSGSSLSQPAWIAIAVD